MKRHVEPVEVAPGVWRFGDPVVSWWLVDDGGRCTVLDAGLPGHWAQLEAWLAARGRTPAAIEAVVLTHGHADHVGLAAPLREHGARVWLHEGDRNLRGGLAPAALGNLWRRSMLQAAVVFAVNGVLKARLPPGVEDLPVDTALDVPGRPRVVPVAGHTAGSCAILLEERDAVATGDALITYDPFTGRRGPGLLPAWDNADDSAAVAALDDLARLGARVVLPGHGEAFTGGVEEAARLASATRRAAA